MRVGVRMGLRVHGLEGRLHWRVLMTGEVLRSRLHDLVEGHHHHGPLHACSRRQVPASRHLHHPRRHWRSMHVAGMHHAHAPLHLQNVGGRLLVRHLRRCHHLVHHLHGLRLLCLGSSQHLSHRWFHIRMLFAWLVIRILHKHLTYDHSGRISRY